MKTLLLTGGSGEIGRAILEKFQMHDYRVIAPSRAELDLAAAESIVQFLNHFKEDVDVFIHCAGFNQPRAVGVLTPAEVEKTMQVNTFAFYSLVNGLLPRLKEKPGSSILAISSMYGDFARKQRLAYVASKHALNGMIKTLALELGEYAIRVNGVAPGFVDTKMTRKNNDEATIANFKRKIPLGRLARADEIAKVSYFLCSEESSYIHGQIIMVDGGYSQGGFQE